MTSVARRHKLRRLVAVYDHNFGSLIMAVGNCWRVPPGHVGRHKGAVLLHSGVGDQLKATVEVLAGLPRKQD